MNGTRYHFCLWENLTLKSVWLAAPGDCRHSWAALSYVLTTTFFAGERLLRKRDSENEECAHTDCHCKVEATLVWCVCEKVDQIFMRTVHFGYWSSFEHPSHWHCKRICWALWMTWLHLWLVSTWKPRPSNPGSEVHSMWHLWDKTFIYVLWCSYIICAMLIFQNCSCWDAWQLCHTTGI